MASVKFYHSIKAAAYISVFLYLLIGCTREKSQDSDGNVAKAVYSSPKTMYAISTIIAAEKGFFKQHGVDIEMRWTKTGKQSLDAILSGNVDFANLVETNIAFASFVDTGSFKVLANIEKIYDAGIICRTEKQQKTHSIENLNYIKGKTIGFLPSTTSEIFLKQALKSQSINADTDVELVELRPVSMQTAITTGDCDCASIWEPYISNIASALGDRYVLFQDSKLFTGYTFFSQSNSRKNTNAENIIEALKQAKQFAEDSTHSAQILIAKALDFDVSRIRSLWDKYDLVIELSEDALIAIEKEALWIKENKKTYQNKNINSISGLIDKSYVSESSVKASGNQSKESSETDASFSKKKEQDNQWEVYLERANLLAATVEDKDYQANRHLALQAYKKAIEYAPKDQLGAIYFKMGEMSCITGKRLYGSSEWINRANKYIALAKQYGNTEANTQYPNGCKK